MFTLKHYPVNGGYRCYEAIWYSVSYDKDSGAHIAYSPAGKENEPALESLLLNDPLENVYVSNSDGKTVDRIHMLETINCSVKASR